MSIVEKDLGKILEDENLPDIVEGRVKASFRESFNEQDNINE